MREGDHYKAHGLVENNRLHRRKPESYREAVNGIRPTKPYEAAQGADNGATAEGQRATISASLPWLADLTSALAILPSLIGKVEPGVDVVASQESGSSGAPRGRPGLRTLVMT